MLSGNNIIAAPITSSNTIFIGSSTNSLTLTTPDTVSFNKHYTWIVEV